MGLEVSGVGIIAFVCRGCQAKLYWYVIGDGPQGNRNKFNGPPTPERALSGYDSHECPVCGRRLSLRPLRMEIMTVKEFHERYVVTDYQVLERSSVVEEPQIHSVPSSVGEVAEADNL
ncbi:MAG: hypothetical protein F7B17_06315 [Desulfurococcales archaeon]|nr:hypothetical protein [Desulfurococcales archaeon]